MGLLIHINRWRLGTQKQCHHIFYWCMITWKDPRPAIRASWGIKLFHTQNSVVDCSTQFTTTTRIPPIHVIENPILWIFYLTDHHLTECSCALGYVTHQNIPLWSTESSTFSLFCLARRLSLIPAIHELRKFHSRLSPTEILLKSNISYYTIRYTRVKVHLYSQHD